MFLNSGIIRETDSEELREYKCKKIFLYLNLFCYTEHNHKNGVFTETDPTLDCSYNIGQYNNFCKEFKFKLVDKNQEKMKIFF